MTESSVLQVNQDSFDQQVLKAPGLVLAEFGAEWCAPCRRLKPLLGQLADERSEVARVVTIDTDHCGELRDRYKISAIPTVIVFRDGEVVRKLIGVVSRDELEQALEQAVTA